MRPDDSRLALTVLIVGDPATADALSVQFDRAILRRPNCAPVLHAVRIVSATPESAALVAAGLRGESTRQAIVAVVERVLESSLDELYRAGIDDHVLAGFDVDDLLFRLTSRPRYQPPTVIIAADLSIDLVDRQVLRRGEPVKLAAREFDVLVVLARSFERTVPVTLLAARVWKHSEIADRHLYRVCVSSLRRVINVREAQARVYSVRGEGYMLGTSPTAGAGV